MENLGKIQECNRNQFWFLAAELLPGGPPTLGCLYTSGEASRRLAPPTHAEHTQVAYTLVPHAAFIWRYVGQRKEITIRQQEAVQK